MGDHLGISSRVGVKKKKGGGIKRQKDKPGWEKIFENTYLIKDYYLKYIKNSKNSTI